MRVGRSGRIAVVLAVGLLLSGIVSGCSSLNSRDGATTSSKSGVAAPSAPTMGSAENLRASDAAATGSAQPSQDRMVIRTQTLRLQVKSTADAIASLRDLAARSDAVITDLQVATESDQWIYRYDPSGASTGDGAALRGWITVRVPAESLSAFTTEAMKLGDVKYQSEGSQDVTQEHVDLAARLENLRAEEQRLRSFFESAKSVQDMLAIETELNRIRGEIESLDAQVQYLERQAAMATVTIELTEDKPVVRPEGDSWGFSDAITAGFQAAANVIKFVIAFLIATAPLWLLAIAAFFVVRAIVRRRRAKMAKAAAEENPA